MYISFIVIGKNEGLKLDRCFNSVVNFSLQNNFDYETIYIDSQSTDNTQEVLREWPTIRHKILGGKCNAARARNLGASLSKGDVLCFVDGDMELLSSFGEKISSEGKLIHPFINGYRVDYLHLSNWEYISDNSVEIKLNLKDKYMITTGGLFIIEKKLWERVDGMDNRLAAYEDNDLAYRVYISEGIKILKLGDILANHYTINYTDISRFKTMVKGNYFKYKGVLLRKHILDVKLWFHFVKGNISFFVLLFSLILTIFHSYFLLAYLIASLSRLFFIKKSKDSTPYLDRFFLNILADIKILLGLFIFFPLNYEPTEKK